MDWVKEAMHVPLAYCYEFRGRGQFVHLLPPDQILPNSQEVMDSIIELIHQGKRFGYFNNSDVVKASILSISCLVIIIKCFM